MERVQKLLAAAGVASRRNAEKLILSGRVTCNGEVVSLLGLQVDPARDVVAVDGVPISAPVGRRTFMLNKPAGYITTRSDTHGRHTVLELAPEIPGLHPIGRLDMDTTGLLLLTNDGDLTYALTHPKHQVNKTYRAWVKGLPTHETLNRLREGVMLEDGMTAPAEVKRKLSRGETTLVEVTIHEGRKREVRRMFETIGHPVVSLARISVGPLVLGDLPEGQVRELSTDEVNALYATAGVTPTKK